MKIAFLIDYSKCSGYGHVNRSLTLASTLVERGHSIGYLLSNQDLTSVQYPELFSCKLSDKPFLTSQTAEKGTFDFSLWNSVIDEWMPDMLIIDSYLIRRDDAIHLAQSLKTVVFERKDLDGHCDYLIDFMPATAEGSSGSQSRTVHLNGPRYFVARKSSPKNISRTGVILHTGGTYRYDTQSSFFKYCALEFRSSMVPITWLVSSKEEIGELMRSDLALSDDSFRYFDPVNSSLWSEFDYVVGPPSGSLFESLIQGCVAITACTSETQNDNMRSWVAIGHLLHLDETHSDDQETVRHICSLALKCRLELLEFAQGVRLSPSPNGCGLLADRIMQVENLNAPDIDIVKSELNSTTYACSHLVMPCTHEDIAVFRDARNLQKNRDVSTSNRKITWVEHVHWWLKGDVHRFKLMRDDKAVAFIWFKAREVLNVSYLYGGWFPSEEKADLTDALEIVRWQVDQVAPKYPHHKWIATFASSNKVAPIINRRMGFVDADLDAINAARILFPGTGEDQPVMVYPS